MYEEWKSILKQINSDRNFNSDHIVTRIKEFLKEKLNAQHQYVYIRWEEAKFNINHPFLLKKDYELYSTYATLLHISADHGLKNVTKALLKVKDINVNAEDTLKETPLHYAAKNGHVDVVKALTAADVNAHVVEDITKNTPLHLATQNGHVDVVKALIEAGADVNAQDKYKTTSLHRAANAEVVKALVEAGADVNAKNEDENTPLHCASNVEVVKALIKEGIDINAKDKNGETPLHWAAKYSKINIANTLIAADADLHAQDKDENTPIDLAIDTKMKKFLKAAETLQFFKPMIIGTSVGFVTAAFEAGMIALLITKGDLSIELMPITMAVFAAAAIVLTIGMIAYHAFKSNKPSTEINETQTFRNSNSIISSVHSIEG